MGNAKTARGLVLLGIGLFFGIQAGTYKIGTLAKAGPGLFPLLVAGLVGFLGLIMILQARVEAPEPLVFKLRNIAILLVGLVGFTLIGSFLPWFKITIAVFFLVFVVALADEPYSIRRNLKICVVLLAIAYGLQAAFGLQLPLF